MAIAPGAAATRSLTVTEDDTAIAAGSGNVAVLATPRLIALCEEAAVAAVHKGLEADETTVGTKVEIEHLAASPVGSSVSARAELVSCEGRLLTFAVEASAGARLIGRGTMIRVLVDRGRFLAGL